MPCLCHHTLLLWTALQGFPPYWSCSPLKYISTTCATHLSITPAVAAINPFAQGVSCCCAGILRHKCFLHIVLHPSRCLNWFLPACSSTACKPMTTPHTENTQKTHPLLSAPCHVCLALSEDWTPKKLEVEVPMPEQLDLAALRSTGPAEGEQLQPEEPAGGAAAAAGPGAAAAGAAAAARPEPDATIVAQLVSMGFSENGSKRAGAWRLCAALVNTPLGDGRSGWVLPLSCFEDGHGACMAQVFRCAVCASRTTTEYHMLMVGLDRVSEWHCQVLIQCVRRQSGLSWWLWCSSWHSGGCDGSRVWTA